MAMQDPITPDMTGKFMDLFENAREMDYMAIIKTPKKSPRKKIFSHSRLSSFSHSLTCLILVKESRRSCCKRNSQRCGD